MEEGLCLLVFFVLLAVLSSRHCAPAPDKPQERDWLDQVIDENGWTNLDYIAAAELEDEWD